MIIKMNDLFLVQSKQDILINSGFGFQEECEEIFNDGTENEDSLFALINEFF